MKRKILLEFICGLLVLLFVYAGLSKFLDMGAYIEGMRVQPFPKWIFTLSYALPFLEIIIATGLVFNNSRMAALYSSAFLMLIFTVYAALIVFNFFKQVPCYCGGIIQGISWAGHLILNVSFLLINVIAILLCSGKKYLCINKGVS